MRTVFADTFYFIALLNPLDGANARAVAFTRNFSGQYVTTRDVLTEVADGLCGLNSRLAACHLIERLPTNGAMRIIWSDEVLFNDAFSLYRARPDKEWSLTDCISFVVMTREGITEALTGDHHFEQAGFVALLK
jgi:predicted nucleic acid-binding protein